MCLFSSFPSTAFYWSYLFSFCFGVLLFPEHTFIKKTQTHSPPQFAVMLKHQTHQLLLALLFFLTEPHDCKHLSGISSAVKLQKQPFEVMMKSTFYALQNKRTASLLCYFTTLQLWHLKIAQKLGVKRRIVPCLSFLFLWVYWTGCSLMKLPDMQLT